MLMNSVTNEIRRLLIFPLKDQAARKNLLFGMLILLGNFIIPVVPTLFVYGYMARVIRNVVQQDKLEMPEWQDWGELLKEGLRLFGALLIYELPLLMLFLLSYLFILIPSFMVIPMSDSEMRLGIWFFIIGELMFFVSIAVILLLSGVYAILMPPMLTHVAVKQEFKAAFRINEWWRVLRANWAGFVAALIVVVGVSSALYLGFYALYLSIVFCCLAPIAAVAVGFYMIVVSAAAIGDAYRTAEQKLANA